MKKRTDDFIKYLREYFTVYLPRQKNASIHTITSCRQTWNLLLKHIAKNQGILLANITFPIINRVTVIDFLEHMVKTRNWSHASYNQRLCCIRSFFKYASGCEALLTVFRDDLAGIPLKNGAQSKIIKFMERDAIKELLHQPDTSSPKGVRDQFFMILMYDTAARNSEMLNMRFNDFDAENLTVYLLGKGAKQRQVPVASGTAAHFRNYASLFHSDGGSLQPMFYTIHRRTKTPMSDDNVSRFIKGYARSARERCSSIPEKVHPHMLRHSRAMHLYRAGMPLALLSEWLGHEDPETTLIYAYSDTEMKRKAIEKAMGTNNPLGSIEQTRIWEGNEDLIQRLCGLK